MINQNFRNEEFEITEELLPFITKASLIDMLDFSRIDFNKSISSTPKLNLQIDSIWKTERIDKVMSFEYGNNLPENTRIKGKFPVVGSNGIVGNHNSYLVKSPCIVVGRKGSVGKVNWIKENCTPIDTTFYV